MDEPNTTHKHTRPSSAASWIVALTTFASACESGLEPELGTLECAETTADCTAETTGTEDVESPTILAVSPADGDHGVLPDAVITVVFSEAMDAEATEAAYRSSALPHEAVSMSWDAAGEVLTVTPRLPLEVGEAEGQAIPTAGRDYWFGFSTSARDLAGNQLRAPMEVEFVTARRIHASLAPVTERRFVLLVQETPYFALHVMKVLTDRIVRKEHELHLGAT